MVAWSSLQSDLGFLSTHTFWFTYQARLLVIEKLDKNSQEKIQKAAPGPPIEIEIATPAILPIPIVPESAVAKA